MDEIFPVYKTRSDLEKLLIDGAVENTRLEFKASAALARDNKAMNDMCIDVSAMANSAGGQIIYGIDESKKTKGPTRVDSGVDDPSITREWIGQVLNARIQPRLNGLRIDEIDLESGKRGFSISVSSTKAGPHQAPDNRYYKRFELEVRPMADYEVRDVMSRASSPYLEPVLTFDGRVTTNLSFGFNAEGSDPIQIKVILRNESSTPAEHTAFMIGVDTSMLTTAYPPLTSAGKFDDGKGNILNWYQRRISAPVDFPIFKELPLDVVPRDTTIVMPGHSLKVREFLICARVYSPGYSCERYWSIKNNGFQLKITEMD